MRTVTVYCSECGPGRPGLTVREPSKYQRLLSWAVFATREVEVDDTTYALVEALNRGDNLGYCSGSEADRALTELVLDS